MSERQRSPARKSPSAKTAASASPSKLFATPEKEIPHTDDSGPDDQVRTGSVDYIVSEILRGLHEGRYVPGQKLIESDLTRRYAVGRGSVREALRRLEAAGLAIATLHRGARIRSFTRDGIRDLAEVSEAILGFAARLAAERVDRAEKLDVFRELVSQMSDLIQAGDSFAIAQLRYRVIQELVSLTGNQELTHMMPRLDAAVARAQFRAAFDVRSAREDLTDFQRVIGFILARDGESAGRIMRSFIRRAAVAIQQLPDDHFDH
ncbi:MAG TPA: GntR family transcriptional regulator [Paraburkholderia sp.]|uniref:GntR family transcriptional regulator n=1 Tax=Paraburkholderia sp. TaxID=1926495 RepID=UPI002B48953F|nr:GntR family transcriptional regulator [Paraburkholderia sp.]HKR46938.1 GntR family transcriptional regulator [Paraburkholderia sp.]